MNGTGGIAGTIGTGGNNGWARESAWDTRDQCWINDTEKGWGCGYNWILKGSATNGDQGVDDKNESGPMNPRDFGDTMKMTNLKLREGLEELAPKAKVDVFDKLQYQTARKLENSVNWTLF